MKCSLCVIFFRWNDVCMFVVLFCFHTKYIFLQLIVSTIFGFMWNLVFFLRKTLFKWNVWSTNVTGRHWWRLSIFYLKCMFFVEWKSGHNFLSLFSYVYLFYHLKYESFKWNSTVRLYFHVKYFLTKTCFCCSLKMTHMKHL